MRTTHDLCLMLLALACIAIAPRAIAQSNETGDELTSYRVEVLVFRNLDRTTNDEDPGRPPMPPMPVEESDLYFAAGPNDEQREAIDPEQDQNIMASENAEAGKEPVVESNPLFFRPSDVFQLDEVAANIRRSRGYRLLLHESWSQPGFPAEASQAVDLLVLERLRSLSSEIDRASAMETNQPVPSPIENSDALKLTLPSLGGSITLYRSRYLHLNFDLAFHTKEGVEFALNERRRMRSGELHFLDSPGLGVIALVVPLESQPVEDVLIDTSDPQPEI